MDSALRPRDIQARIRAGETPEHLAELGGTSLDRVMVYAGPVLAEREHVARRAQDSSVRRRSGEAARGTRTLGEAVGAHLRSRNASPSAVQWDAWRREDGRWTLTARFAAGEREGTASFTFDARGSYVTPEDDHARWLVGEPVPAAAPAEAGSDDLAGARARRLTAVPGDDLGPAGPVPAGAGLLTDETALGDDAIELVSDDPAPGGPAAPRPAAGSPAPSAGAADDAQLELPTGDPTDEADEVDGADQDDDLLGRPDVARSTPPPEATEPAESQETSPTPPRRPVSKKRGRASVPSWDEIMFGGNDQ